MTLVVVMPRCQSHVEPLQSKHQVKDHSVASKCPTERALPLATQTADLLARVAENQHLGLSSHQHNDRILTIQSRQGPVVGV